MIDKLMQEAADKLLHSVSAVFGVSVEEIKSKSRIRDIVDARKAVVYFLRDHLKMNNVNIARQIRKDHCGINSMYELAQTLMQHDDGFRIKMDRVKASTGLTKEACPCCGKPYERA